MIDEVRRQATAEGVANAFVEQAVAQIHRFDDGSFEVVLTRSAAMVLGDQLMAFTPPRPAARRGSIPIARDSAEGDDHDPVRRHP
jgi:hypothetical protein